MPRIRGTTVSLRNRSLLLGVVLVVLAGTNVVYSPPLLLPSFNSRFAKSFVSQLGTQPDFEMRIEPNQFLVANGSSGSPSLVFTSLNGFAGNVTLSATVYPHRPWAPSVSFSSLTLRLNASLPGSVSYPMIIQTTNRTQSGLYNITVIGSAGSLAHSASATAGVTKQLVPSNGADLFWQWHFNSIAHVGGSIVLENTFEDLGYLGIYITDLAVDPDFGLFQYPHPPTPPFPYVCAEGLGESGYCTKPILAIHPFQTGTLPFSIQIPNGTLVGDHPVTITIGWTLNFSNTSPQPAPDLVAHTRLVVYSQQSNSSSNKAANILDQLTRILVPIFGAITLISVLIVAVTLFNRRRDDKIFRKTVPLLAPGSQSRQGGQACPNCGAQNTVSARFCGNCGQKIS